MEWIGRVRRRWRALRHKVAVEREMDEEMRFHLEMEAAELVRSGERPEEAWRRARLAFGGVERFKEVGRDARGVRLADDLGSDARYALRQLRRSPGFAAATLLTLALGIGATTAMFSVCDALLLRPYWFRETDRLVDVKQCDGCPGMTA